MTRNERIKTIQRLYGLVEDGIVGPKTRGAVLADLDGTWMPPVDLGQIDERSARIIASLLPEAQPYFVRLYHALHRAGLPVKFISGTRSYQEQNALYAKFKSGGPRAAPPGHSFHNFGLAIDAGMFSPAGKYVPEGPDYARMGKIAEGLDPLFKWGGRFGDEPHIELFPPWAGREENDSATLAELRRRHEQQSSLWK